MTDECCCDCAEQIDELRGTIQDLREELTATAEQRAKIRQRITANESAIDDLNREEAAVFSRVDRDAMLPIVRYYFDAKHGNTAGLTANKRRAGKIFGDMTKRGDPSHGILTYSSSQARQCLDADDDLPKGDPSKTIQRSFEWVVELSKDGEGEDPLVRVDRGATLRLVADLDEWQDELERYAEFDASDKTATKTDDSISPETGPDEVSEDYVGAVENELDAIGGGNGADRSDIVVRSVQGSMSDRTGESQT